MTARGAADHVYDGPSSRVPLDPAKFLGSTDGPTVGDYFAFSNLRIALSQYNGYALFLKLGQWPPTFLGLSAFLDGPSGKINSYGMGLLAHELLHKEVIFGGLPGQEGHDTMIQALNSVDAPTEEFGQGDAIGGRIALICPINP